MNGKGEFFEDRIVAWFVAATVAWALFGMLAGLYLAAEMVWADFKLGFAGADFRSLAHRAHQLGRFRLRRLRSHRHLVLQRPTHMQGAAFRSARGVVCFLGLAGGAGVGDGDAFFGDEQRQRIRRIRMAARYRGRDFVDRLRRRLFRHDCEAESAPDLCLELVLRRAHHRADDAACGEFASPCRSVFSNRIRFTPARATRLCNGGMATTRSDSF